MREGKKPLSQKEGMRELLKKPCDSEELWAELTALGLEPTFGNAINLAVLRRALRGETDSLKFVRDSMSEKNGGEEAPPLPVRALDLRKLSDAELISLAERADSSEL